MGDVVYFLLQVKERDHHWSSINLFYCQSKYRQELALSTDPHYLSCRKIRQDSSNPQLRFWGILGTPTPNQLSSWILTAMFWFNAPLKASVKRVKRSNTFMALHVADKMGCNHLNNLNLPKLRYFVSKPNCSIAMQLRSHGANNWSQITMWPDVTWRTWSHQEVTCYLDMLIDW